MLNEIIPKYSSADIANLFVFMLHYTIHLSYFLRNLDFSTKTAKAGPNIVTTVNSNTDIPIRQ